MVGPALRWPPHVEPHLILIDHTTGEITALEGRPVEELASTLVEQARAMRDRRRRDAAGRRHDRVRVDWATLARYAESSGGLATMVGAGIDTYYPPELPAPIVLPLTVQLRGGQEEMVQPHQISFRILDADLDQVGEEGTLGFQSEPNPNIEEGWEAGVLLTVVSQFVAESEGPYSIEIAIDGEHKKSVPFRVLPAGEPDLRSPRVWPVPGTVTKASRIVHSVLGRRTRGRACAADVSRRPFGTWPEGTTSRCQAPARNAHGMRAKARAVFPRDWASRYGRLGRCARTTTIFGPLLRVDDRRGQARVRDPAVLLRHRRTRGRTA